MKCEIIVNMKAIKKNFLLIVIIGIFFSFSLHAQYAEVPYNLETEFTGQFSEKRFTKGDTIYINTYDIGGKEIPGRSSQIEYRRSADGLIDTVFHLSGAGWIDMQIYSPDGRLITYKNLHRAAIPNNYTLIPYDEENYSYTADGRIESIVYQSYMSDLSSVIYYDYSRHLITKTYKREDKEGLEELTRIEYTDSGYVATKYAVDIVEKDTTYQLKRTIEYIFDSEGRLIRKIHDCKINYSYKNQGYYCNGTTYIFNEDGFIQEIKGTETTWFKYIYYGDNPQSAILISNDSQPVYGMDGFIVVTTECKAPVCIYDINGQLVKKATVFANEPIPMAKGIYIVTVNNCSYKVGVK